MHKRSITKFLPGFEPLEEKRTLSAGASTSPLVNLRGGPRALASRSAETPGAVGEVARDRALLDRQGNPIRGGDGGPLARGRHTVSPKIVISNHGYAVYRITNPNQFNDRLIPPFSHVSVQARKPVPGQVYNVLYVAVRNGTAQTFDASSGFKVRFPGSRHSFPILTGDQQWKPGEELVFYVLTKEFYPVPNVVSSGYEFDLGGIYSVAIPGPSGIFLGIKYNPATFDRTLDWIVTSSPGVPGGAEGIKFGLPDTAIYELLSARTDRSDWGGYF